MYLMHIKGPSAVAKVHKSPNFYFVRVEDPNSRESLNCLRFSQMWCRGLACKRFLHGSRFKPVQNSHLPRLRVSHRNIRSLEALLARILPEVFQSVKQVRYVSLEDHILAMLLIRFKLRG